MILIEDNDILIRSMTDENTDYQLMLKWLTDERVLEHYEGRDKKFTIESIIAKYSPQIRKKEGVIPCIIEYKGREIGYIQYYKDLEPDEIFKDVSEIYGLDLFIGEPDLWNMGIGSLILKMTTQYSEKPPVFSQQRLIFL